LNNPFQRGYLHQIGLIHQSHAVGEANGSIMVVKFVDCCIGGGRYFPYYSYRRNPMGREFFVPTGTLIAVELLIRCFLTMELFLIMACFFNLEPMASVPMRIFVYKFLHYNYTN
jgi:hypothetical protein